MKFARRSRRGLAPSAVELAPLVDVVLLLLIFFVVSTTFVRRTELRIDLPEAAGDLFGSSAGDAGDIEVRIDAAGRYAVNERLLANGDVASLRMALEAARQEGSRLIVAADAAVAHQAVVRVLEAAGGIGLRDVRIITRQPPGQQEQGVPDEVGAADDPVASGAGREQHGDRSA